MDFPQGETSPETSPVAPQADPAGDTEEQTPAPEPPEPTKTASRTHTPPVAQRIKTPTSAITPPSTKSSRGNLSGSNAGQESAAPRPQADPRQSPTRASQSKIATASHRGSKASNLALSRGTVELDDKAPKVELQNTYQLAPVKKFRSDAVQSLAVSVLEQHLAGIKYNPDEVGELCLKITNRIQQEVKSGFQPVRVEIQFDTSVAELQFDRYRFVVDVIIGETKGQGVRSVSRCLWDTATDASATATFRNGTLFAVAIVFGLYLQ